MFLKLYMQPRRHVYGELDLDRLQIELLRSHALLTPTSDSTALKLETAPARSTSELGLSRINATKKALQFSRPGYRSRQHSTPTGAKDLGYRCVRMPSFASMKGMKRRMRLSTNPYHWLKRSSVAADTSTWM